LPGRSSLLSAVGAFLLGMAVLAYFIRPSDWVKAVLAVKPHDLLWSSVFFLAGCLAMSERWRACLAYRAGFAQAFHSLGIAMAGNLLIPGRSGEPLRVYALAQRGLPAELSTSAVVQERLADQLFRIIFLVLALLLSGSSAQGANYRLLGILLGTVGLFALIGLMVRYRLALARHSGRWIGKLPKLHPDMVETFVRNTLTDLATMGSRPGGPQALLWGALAWGLLAVHTNYVLSSFFGPGSFTLACVAMAFATPTTSGKPGYYHVLLTASLMVFSAPREPALQAAVVLHLYQGVFYTLWGVVGWPLLQGGARISVRGDEAIPPR
jgi:hypothetical protein